MAKPLNASFFPKDKVPGVELQGPSVDTLKAFERTANQPSGKTAYLSLFSLNLANAVLWANTWHFVVVLIYISELVKLHIFSLSIII